MEEITLLIYCVSIWTVVLGMSYDGCPDGWTALHQHCYFFGVLNGRVSPAEDACKVMDAHLASLWGKDERNFIVDNLWKTEVPRDGFAWYGLHGDSSNQWAWRDSSKFQKSQMPTVSGSPGDKTNKCGALMGLGNYAFLDCNMDAQAYVCKKALPMVYTTSSLANHSTVSSHSQLFERVVPPKLSALPSASLQIAQIEVASETGCAYVCFNVQACTAFENTCVTSSTCKNYQCKLLQSV